MRITKRFLIACLIVCAISASSISAGGNSGQFGIGFTVTESTPSFILHYWISDKFTISPDFSVSKITDPSFTRFNYGVTLAIHTRPGQSFRPFFGAAFNNDVISFSDNTFSDIYFGPMFGAEYFFSDNFSITGMYQVQFILTDDLLSPSNLQPGTTYISTAQLLTVQYYF